jgi:hypothetical protein
VETIIEIKILFKNGVADYYTIDQNIERVYETLGDAIRDDHTGVLDLIHIGTNKKTIINIQEIVTFGYSMVTK